ncbi:MAG: hypothetical protein ACLPV8_27590 [Steroidobacteraceae bacterium]
MKFEHWLPFAVLLPMMSWADAPFAGAWVIQPELSKFEDSVSLGFYLPTLFLMGGSFRRTDCRGQPIDVPADGSAHEVKGQPLFDAMSVRVLDDHRVEIVQKRADKVVWKGLYTVSANGRALTLEFEDDRAAKPATGVLEYVREGDPGAGAHVLTGTWRPQTLKKLSPTGPAMTMTMTAGPDPNTGFTLTESDGRSADGRIDAQQHALNGYLEGATISVSRLSPNMLQINRYQNRMLVEISRATVSDDGQTIRLQQTDWLCPSIVIINLKRQLP